MKGLLRFVPIVFFSLALINPPFASAQFKGITIAAVSPSWNTVLPVAVAEKAGFFRQERLNVRSVILASSGPIMMAILASEEADMVISGAVAILRGISQGAPAVIVGGVRDKVDYTLIGAKGLKGVDDLRGKAIGFTGIGGFGEFAVVEALRRHGFVKDRDYTLINIEGGALVRMAALRAGKVHAVPLTPGQRVMAEAEGFPVLLEIWKELPDMPFTVVTARKKFVAANPSQVAAVLRAFEKAMALIKKDRDGALQLGRQYGLRGDLEIERKALDIYAEAFQVRLRRESVATLLEALKIKGNPEDFFNDSFLPQSSAAR